jgi:hypothetical protein
MIWNSLVDERNRHKGTDRREQTHREDPPREAEIVEYRIEMNMLIQDYNLFGLGIAR